jgi:acetoin utilization deacetylase AcuC-like enzyme
MKIVYSDRYRLDFGSHVFPTIKYAHIRGRLLGAGVANPQDFIEPVAATWDDIALVHTAEYLEKLQGGGLSLQEIAQMEIPWSPQIVEGFRLMVGGTLLAARLALEETRVATPAGATPSAEAEEATARRWAVVAHLGGGFHHASRNHGEGFCMFNDVAIAVRALKRDGLIRRAAIVDCDVHHGNGTATIFTGEPSVFTFSMHQLYNYPALKPPGSLDIALDDQTTDDEYLEELREALPRVFASRAQIAFYLAGADPYAEDQLGGLRLSKDGLRRRDRVVLDAARRACVPLVVTLAGGYARHVEDTIDIHVATIEEAKAALRPPADEEPPPEC